MNRNKNAPHKLEGKQNNNTVLQQISEKQMLMSNIKEKKVTNYSDIYSDIMFSYYNSTYQLLMNEKINQEKHV